MTQLFDAVSQGNLSTVKTLLAQKPFLVYFRLPDGSTPLHVSALWGTLNTAQFLVQKGADINAHDARSETPLLKALWLPTGIFERRAKNMQAFLLEKGADAGAVDVDGSSALHRAVLIGKDELIAPLLAKNVNVNERNKTGLTPIFALMNRGADLQLVRTLLDKGASLTIRPTDGNGASLLARAAQAGRRDIVQLLIEKGADVNGKDSENRAPLTSLIFNGSMGPEQASVAELLLEKGANPNDKVWDETLISRIINSDSQEMLKVFLASKKVSLKAVNDRQSPLVQSINYGRREMVKLLLEAGADPNEPDEQGRTALQVATSYSPEMAELFKNPKPPAN
ncbi:hypothetical protein EON80_03025 [bacterium]|nr:MAG: hypothetical protein EON80_03025 [bacterium]